jgi:hypothetical protein
MSNPGPALLAAYRAADYVIDDGAVVGRIDATSDGFAARLRAHGAASAALLTSCNPFSRLLSPAMNAARLAALEAELADAGRAFIAAEGRAPDLSWREPGLLIFDLRGAEADALCRRWQQHAWVRVDADGRLELRIASAAADPPTATMRRATGEGGRT